MNARQVVLALIGATVGAACFASQASDEVGLVIVNARIIDGNGGVVERGTVVVRGGRIESAGGSPPSQSGLPEIDATGLTLMPGFIDGHRHVIGGDPELWMREQAKIEMQDALDAGITTILSCGDPLKEILELRRKLEREEIDGPRLLVAGRVPLAQPSGPPPSVDPARAESSWAPRSKAEAIPPEDTAAAVQRLGDVGVDAIKTVMMVTPGGPEAETLERVVAAAEKLGLPVVTHAVTVTDTLAAVEAGVAVLVHTPVEGDMSPDAVRRIAGAGIPMTSTLGVFVPFFSASNEALFRDGTAFPWERLYHAGEGAVNARLLWNAGITLGFGTDTRYGVAPERRHRDLLAHEIRSLRLTFSPQDIVTIMTRNAAHVVNRPGEIGTIEPGKLADLVLLEGDPLVDSDALLNVAMVIKGGRVVVDRR